MEKCNKHSLVAVVILFGIITMTLSGCLIGMWDDPYRYRGEHRDLFSEVASSVLGITGMENSKVVILETDSYGRTLFSYAESTGLLDDGITLAVLIAQRSDENYVYYYEDQNYILRKITNKDQGGSAEAVKEMFSAEELEQLKRQNDWEQELCPEKMCRREIIYKKSQDLPNKILKNAFALLPENYDYRFSLITLLCRDSSGRWLYSFRGAYKVRDLGETYILMFQPDGTIDPELGIEKLEDPLNYQEQLAEFKERNGWEK